MNALDKVKGLVERWNDKAQECGLKADRPYQDDATTNWHQGLEEAFTDCADELAAILPELEAEQAQKEMKKEVDEHGVAHITQAGGNIFQDLGFDAEEAKRLQAQAYTDIEQKLSLQEAPADEVTAGSKKNKQ